MISVVHYIDNREYIKTVPDKFFPLVIDDPPYGIFSENKKTGFQREYETSAGANKWDMRPEPEYFKELFRISKNQIIWGAQYFTADLPDFSQPIIWDKKTGENYFADGEMAFCSFPGTLRIYRHQWAGAFKDSERNEKAIQACQKPIALYEDLLQNYAKPGWTIFDPHTGSGSLRIACFKLGFDYMGCENNRQNWEAQEKRYNSFVENFHIYKGQVPLKIKSFTFDPFNLKSKE